MSHLLDVYFGPVKAGVLGQDESGALSYVYDNDYLAGQESQAISFSMPLQEGPYPDRVARPFFSGLLPDESGTAASGGRAGHLSRQRLRTP